MRPDMAPAGTMSSALTEIQIRLQPYNINRDNGVEIPEAWMPTIRKHSWEHSDVGIANHRATRLPNHDPAGAIQAARHPVYIR